MTKAEIKPCQCGGEAKYAAKIGKLVFVDCTKCGMGGPEDAWNHRPTEQALIDALHDCLNEIGPMKPTPSLVAATLKAKQALALVGDE